ncbi:MAG TPA: LysR family transcriptional regulator [Verrucomicrobiae bacterium]|nr:LysR family transcriptional regulator [Verrucomicrobiae bacterium]
MNVHHLELFYYVARHGGITPAVRNIPYGIQQPAVSGQIAQLEEFLGVTLFQRRPFALTPDGEKLYQFIQPFFSNLDKLAAELQGGQVRHLSIGASTIILRDHLPGLIQALKKKFPGLRISLRDGYPAYLETLLLREEIDVAITLIEEKNAPGIHAESLLRLPLVLLVNKNSGIRSAAELWKRDKITEPLICLPPGEPICKLFQKKLGELNVDWFPSIEASSVDLIETYVAGDLGIGVSVAIPQKKPLENVRVLPLPDFPPVILGALWRGKMTPLLETLLQELRLRAGRLTRPASASA